MLFWSGHGSCWESDGVLLIRLCLWPPAYGIWVCACSVWCETKKSSMSASLVPIARYCRRPPPPPHTATHMHNRSSLTLPPHTLKPGTTRSCLTPPPPHPTPGNPWLCGKWTVDVRGSWRFTLYTEAPSRSWCGIRQAACSIKPAPPAAPSWPRRPGCIGVPACTGKHQATPNRYVN
jgi:hypothetical protein